MLRLSASARDPEGATPIVWSLVTELSTPPQMATVNDVSDADDFADNASFEIDQGGVLTFKRT